MNRWLIIALMWLMPGISQAQDVIVFDATIAAAAGVIFAPTFTHPGYLNLATYNEVDMMNPVSDDALNHGLVAWWKALPQTKGGSTFYDLMGVFNGTLITMDSATDWIVTDRGYTLDFDGSNDHVSVPDDDRLDILGPVTLAIWIKSTDTGNVVVTEKRIPENELTMQPNTTADGRWFYLDTNNGAPGVRGDIIDGTWHHVVGTFDGVNKFLFVDGVQVHTATMDVPVATSGAFTIGARVGGAGAFEGLVDDVRIYDRELSATEVLALHLDGLCSHCRTLNYIGQ